MTILTQWRVALDAVYPGLWNASLGMLVVLGVWLLKKLAPNLFAKLPPAVQALPAMILSAIVTALSATSPTVGGFLSQLLAGSLIGGTMAVGAHRVLKESPLPYGGPSKPPSLRPPPVAGIVMVIVMLTAIVSCTPAEEQEILNVASNVVDIAKVLCLADQAKIQKRSVRELSVQDVCQTIEQLAPYKAAAEAPGALASRGCP